MNTPSTKYDFDPMAAKYDRCNHLFSLGIDHLWRKELVKNVNAHPRNQVLDLCCGTGDVVFSFLKHSSVQNVIGLDVSELMIDLAQEKQIRFSSKHWMHSKKLSWKLSDAAQTGLDPESIDIVTCAFGIRNIPDRSVVLNEIHRLLRSKGKLAILEFSLPGNPLLRYLYKFYLNCVMPWLAKWIVGSKEPLQYLARSIGYWHTEVDFSSELSKTDFNLARKVPLTGGIATLWIAIKK